MWAARERRRSEMCSNCIWCHRCVACRGGKNELSFPKWAADDLVQDCLPGKWHYSDAIRRLIFYLNYKGSVTPSLWLAARDMQERNQSGLLPRVDSQSLTLKKRQLLFPTLCKIQIGGYCHTSHLSSSAHCLVAASADMREASVIHTFHKPKNSFSMSELFCVAIRESLCQTQLLLQSYQMLRAHMDAQIFQQALIILGTQHLLMCKQIDI